MQNFIHDESGAVTVDWVVLTAALVGLGLAVLGVVSGGISGQSEQMSDVMEDGAIIRTAFTGNATSALAGACAAASCAGFTMGDDLKGMSTDALETLATDNAGLDGVATFDTASYDANLAQNGDGAWGTYADPADTDSAFTTNDDATADYNQRAANDAYKSAIAAEQGARVN